MTTPQLKTYSEAFTADAHGQLQLTGIVDIKDYRDAHLEIVQHPGNVPNLSVEVHMGKISGATLAQVIGSFPLGTAIIHSFAVRGPELAVWIRGAPANAVINVQAWLFLH